MHPSFYYIRYLIAVGGEDITLEAISKDLVSLGFSSLSESLYNKILNDLQFPENLKLWDKKDRTSKTWLKDKKIYSMVHRDYSIENVFTDIMFKPRIREAVEKSILGNITDREAVYRLNKLKMPMQEETFSLYRHYFWNSDIMGLSDWDEYFKNDDSTRTTVTAQQYTNALFAGPEVTLYRLGIKEELDSKKIMVEMQQELYHSFLEAKTLPLSVKKIDMLSALSRSLAKIDERIQAGDTALQDTLKKFEKFKISSPKLNLKDIGTLAPTGSITNVSKAEMEQRRKKDG